jgi:hypothetical protein
MAWHYHRDMFEVTCLSRPDETWKFTDEQGHAHQWEWPSGDRRYDPAQPATLPTCVRITDKPYYTEEGDEIGQFHWECKDCHAHVKPGYKADDHRVYIPGILRQVWMDD